jgi:WD40 repeat protein
MLKIEVKKVHSLTGHRDCVYTLQPSDQPDVFFSASGDGMVVQWNLTNPDTGQLLAKLPNSIYALHYHPLSNILVVGHNYDGIHFIDWENKRETGSLQLTRAAIFDIQSSGNTLYIGDGEGWIYQVNLASKAVLNKLKCSEKSVRTLAIHEGRKELAAGFSDHYIRIFDLETLGLKQEWKAHTNSVFTVRYTPDGDRLLSGSRDARLKAWNVSREYQQTTEVVAHMYAINSLDFSPDKKHFVTCSLDKSIKVWDAKELKLLKVIDRARHAGHGTSVNKVLWTSYNDQFISASDDRTISVWHIIF